ncbi:hypothetical protein [Sagittula sp. S175]|uniref:hypothetical protein n=1 Tax=Sagittula sp. S175 TaxID=3415129 RepID=UPI003C7C0814
MVKRVHIACLVLFGAVTVAGLASTSAALSGRDKPTAIATLGATLLSSGPIQQGHASLACQACHDPAPGTLRQQMQVLARGTPVDVGFSPVNSAICADCHDRPADRHPIHRFNEPRFRKALDTVQANTCLGCHSEHENRRLHRADTGFRAACHADLTLKRDPLDVPHVTLVKQDNWQSCLTCHDFHGNHAHSPQTRMQAAFPLEAVNAYFADGPSPYGLKPLTAKDAR